MRKLKPFACCIPFFLLIVHFCNAQKWEALNPPLNIFNGTIYSTAVDASGNIYAAGDFYNASHHCFVATWNGSNWSELGTGASALNANNTILTLASSGNNLYAAGGFIDSLGYTYVSKWNGSTWSELDTSLHANGLIYSIAVDKSGNVYAAGGFTNSAGNYYVAKWDGNKWNELGNGVNALNANKEIFAITTDADGNVYAGGWFTNGSGKEYVAKWNGSLWSEVGAGASALNANDFIRCLATDNAGNVYAGGNFRNSNNEYYLAKWNGNTWSETGNRTFNDAINTIAIKNEHEIYAAGYFTDGGHYVAKWDGNSWSQINNLQSPLVASDDILSIQVDANNNIYAGGKFLNKSGHSFIAKWNGTGWNEPGSKGDPFYFNNLIYEIEGDTADNVYVSGSIYENGEIDYIQHWNGGGWSTLPMSQSPLNVYITRPIIFTKSTNMTLDKSGNLYVTGRYNDGTISYDCVLKWDGKNWSVLENSPNELTTFNDNPVYNSITQIETDEQGNVYVLGEFNPEGIHNLAKWDGMKWSYLSQPNGSIEKILPATDGSLYAYGSFFNQTIQYSIAHIINGKLEEVNNEASKLNFPGSNLLTAIEIDSKNNIYINGLYNDSAGNHYVRKWDGVKWSNFGTANSVFNTLAKDVFDNIYSTGGTSSSEDCAIKKWNGSAWVGVGVPIEENSVYPFGHILGVDAAGNIYADAVLNGTNNNFIAKFQPVNSLSPKLISFTPQSGSLGTKVTITGQNLSNTSSVKFGGKEASSFIVNNDSTITAIVGDGSTGSVMVETLSGTDSLQTFTFTCDSIKGPVPTVTTYRDTFLVSSFANYYQWFFNNNKLENDTFNIIPTSNTGFYHVATSTDKICWVSSLDYPILISRQPLNDTLKMNIYPNPAQAKFTVDVKLPQTTTVTTYVSIYDANGNQVMQTNKLVFYGNEIRIPLTLKNKGNYFVKVYVNGDTRQQTLIIM